MVEASLRNLSLAGVACTTQVPFEEMAELAITLELPDPEDTARAPELVHARGAVVRCQPARRGTARRRYELALYFTELEPESRTRLDSFIRRRTPAATEETD